VWPVDAQTLVERDLWKPFFGFDSAWHQRDMTPTDALTRLGGVASHREVCRLASRRQLRTAVEKGEVFRVSPGVYASTDCDAARVAAARVGGVVSHLSAALHWGWKVKLLRRCDPPSPRGPGRLATGGSGGRDPPLPLAPRSRGASPSHRPPNPRVASRPGRPCRSPSRRSHARAAQLAAAKASPRTGRAKALKVVRAASRLAANPFESVLRAIAIEVPGLCVVPQQRVAHIGYVDPFDHRLGLVIEAESYQWHSSRTALARDVRRYTWCARLGYTVVRFTWEEVMFHPEYVRAVLLDLVALGPRARAVGRPNA